MSDEAVLADVMRRMLGNDGVFAEVQHAGRFFVLDGRITVTAEEEAVLKKHGAWTCPER